MPQHNHAPARHCSDCSGFASVAIATGLRLTDGSRDTVPVNCPTCHGTGTVPAPTRRTLTRA
ncbi:MULTISPECIES: hypothetical protein [unclassified Kitasatospora]|uniref:hypothetical protein n=1 Tax=unclassified Kitasatospora TaxID=2633591 RepID=UPI00070CF726|nr:MULTISPECIES: hypothetical protein [unclassified Kitasatospora]KQV15324.1 hypothetical protein ASC99_06860 [Kitasatospora sp. Root107]KRB64088.1 hypothetical protein ASE03_05995 [Kitasatospora sp. Root187]